jgi:hypothetical protein
MHAYSVAVFDHALGALSAILGKAEAHCEARKIDPQALLQARLFPDMFPLVRQVQLATDFAKGASARLAGAEVPAFADTETGFGELTGRIARTRDFLATLTPAMLDGDPMRPIRWRTRAGEQEAPALPYLTQVALPNFYFHVTTAYNLLRHNGVEIGKSDFIGR